MTAPSTPSAQRMPPASLLFPWRAWMHHPWLRSGVAWTVVGLVVVPPLALVLQDGRSGSVVPTAIVFAAYFAVAWGMLLRIVVQPQRIDAGVLALVAGLALLEVPVAMVLERALDADPDNLVLGIVTVGLPEEAVKLAPVAVLVLTHRRARTVLAPRDFLFLGAVSGLVFGAVEAVHYVVDVMNVSSAEDGLTVVWRLVAGPVSHACLAGISGYFLGLASRYREPQPLLALAGIGIGVPAVLHGLSNWVSGTPAWVAIEIVTTLVFLGYARIGLVAATPRPAPVDQPTVRIPAVGSTGMPLTAAGARPTVGTWAPTPRSAPSPTWRP